MILAVILVFTVILVSSYVGYVLTSDKLVRIIFPYIKRNGNNTVIFGFVFKYPIHVPVLFWGVHLIIIQVILIFWYNILIIYKNNNNPFSVTSVELQCFYDNDTIAELTAIERQELDEDIHCFAINFNTSGAMDQATGALAFGWIVTTILTWVVLNVNYTITQRIKKVKESSDTINGSYSLLWLLLF